MKQGILWLCLCSSGLSAVAVETESVYTVSGDVQQIGSMLVVSSDDVVKLTGAALLSVVITDEPRITDAANIAIRASNAKREPVAFDQADQRRWLIKEPGKTWVDVTVIDFSTQYFTQVTALVDVKSGPIVPDVPDATPAPSAQLQELVAPIVTKLQADPGKAAKVASAFDGFATAITGKSGTRIPDVSKFGQVNTIALSDLDMGSGVSIGADIETVLIAYVGIEKSGAGFVNRTLTASDRVKIADVYRAVAWAGRQ